MSITKRTKALILCGAVLAIGLAFSVRYLNTQRSIAVIGGADGPTAIFMAGNPSPEEKQEIQHIQLQERLGALLQSIDGVEDALVTLAPGGDAAHYQSAAVSVLLTQGASFTEDQRSAVVTLVCNATGLPKEAVTLSSSS